MKPLLSLILLSVALCALIILGESNDTRIIHERAFTYNSIDSRPDSVLCDSRNH